MKSEDKKRQDSDLPMATSLWEWEYHHTGIPTKDKKPDEKYIPHLKMYVSGFSDSAYGIEWMRFDDDSPVHPLVQKVAHPAFVVQNLDKVIKNKKTLLPPTKPSDGVRVAMIEENGAPVELIEFINKKSKNH